MTICTDCCENRATILVHEADIQLCQACWDIRVELYQKASNEHTSSGD